MDLIKSDERGKVYKNEEFKIFYRLKNSISGDNSINSYERIYLISGEAEVTVGGNTNTFSSPAEFEIPAETYHKIRALTDITFVLKKLILLELQ